MKKLLLLITVAIFSSCGSKLDTAFELYLQTEIAKSANDSIEYKRSVQEFKQFARSLDIRTLNDLEKQIKVHKADKVRYSREKEVVNSMLDNMLK